MAPAIRSRADMRPSSGRSSERDAGLGEMALLCIDMQESQIFGLADRARRVGLEDVADRYAHEVRKVIDNLATLQARCRQAGLPVIHLKTMSYTDDGRDGSPLFRLYGAPEEGSTQPGSYNSPIIAEVGPVEGETVVGKICSGAFNGSELDLILRRMGIGSLLVCGLVTASCVENTVRGASDRGYNVLVVEDGCTDWTEANHRHSIAVMGKWFATITTTSDAAALIAEHSVP